jgi:phenylpropionate dioxygenase-like ring-hydroxylating dioxygenase large terminal subunit
VRGLPASDYLDPARTVLEAATLFERSWQFACHAADLPSPGTAARLDCAGRSVFVLRGRDGELRAFRNACRHRGTRLVDGDALTGLAFCIDARVRCPYHGWTYDDAGRLLEVPDAQCYTDLEPDTLELHTAWVEQWRGLVFVAFRQPEGSLHERLDGLFADWPHLGAWRRLDEPVVTHLACDWKIACEHLLDGAHGSVTRPRRMPRVFESPRYSPCGPHALEASAALAHETGQASWSVRAFQALATAAQAEPRARYLYLWPNQRLCLAPDGASLVQVLPSFSGGSAVREVAFGSPAARRELRLMRYARQRVDREARRGEARLLERVQHGLASLPAGETGPIDDDETGVRWFVQCYREAMGHAATPPPTRRRNRARGPRRRVAPAQV